MELSHLLSEGKHWPFLQQNWPPVTAVCRLICLQDTEGSVQEPAGTKYHLERTIKFQVGLILFLPLLTKRILASVIAVSDQLLLQVGELPPGVVHIPGEFGKPPTYQVVDTSEALVQNHRVLNDW